LVDGREAGVMGKRFFLRPQVRAILAWLGACLTAGLGMSLFMSATASVELFNSTDPDHAAIEIIGFPFAMALGLSAFAASLTALPVPILLIIIRYCQLPRGWADAGIGGIPGYIAIVTAGVMLSSPSGPMATPSDAAAFAAMFLFPGWLAGYVYWQLAGRPTPPYT
jgi:hypothetical protein